MSGVTARAAAPVAAGTVFINRRGMNLFPALFFTWLCRAQSTSRRAALTIALSACATAALSWIADADARRAGSRRAGTSGGAARESVIPPAGHAR